jgi:hypothetical protein
MDVKRLIRIDLTPFVTDRLHVGYSGQILSGA